MAPNLDIAHLFGYFMEIEGLIRALRMVYNDDSSSYDEPLLRITLTIHQRNLQKLAIETFKFKHNLAPAILNDIFHKNMFKSRKVSTVFNGTETVRNRAQQTWDMVPDDIKNSKSLNEFKNK